jgi:hypothetical protein
VRTLLSDGFGTIASLHSCYLAMAVSLAPQFLLCANMPQYHATRGHLNGVKHPPSRALRDNTHNTTPERWPRWSQIQFLARITWNTHESSMNDCPRVYESIRGYNFHFESWRLKTMVINMNAQGQMESCFVDFIWARPQHSEHHFGPRNLLTKALHQGNYITRSILLDKYYINSMGI